jgi:hypothetical protein
VDTSAPASTEASAGATAAPSAPPAAAAQAAAPTRPVAVVPPPPVKELNALGLLWTVFKGWLAGLFGRK